MAVLLNFNEWLSLISSNISSTALTRMIYAFALFYVIRYHEASTPPSGEKMKCTSTIKSIWILFTHSSHIPESTNFKCQFVGCGWDFILNSSVLTISAWWTRNQCWSRPNHRPWCRWNECNILWRSFNVKFRITSIYSSYKTASISCYQLIYRSCYSFILIKRRDFIVLV